VKTLLKVVVGSRLHRLDTEHSDRDTASIVVAPLREIFSPYRDPQIEQNRIGEKDDVVYELRRFCKLAASANPTVLEVLWSDIVLESTAAGNLLRENRRRFLNSRRVYEAHLGYAASQVHLIRPASDIKRVGKAAAAFIRVLVQGIELLRHGDFSPQASRHVDLLMTLKRGVTVDFVDAYARPVFAELRQEIQAAFGEAGEMAGPDVEWIETFLVDTYLEAHAESGIGPVMRS
jgi:predicted nucleotidyltransferase